MATRPGTTERAMSELGADIHGFIRDLDGFRDQLMQRRRQVWLRANQAGVTYEELAESAGVHPSLINLELRRAREALAS